MQWVLFFFLNRCNVVVIGTSHAIPRYHISDVDVAMEKLVVIFVQNNKKNWSRGLFTNWITTSVLTRALRSIFGPFMRFCSLLFWYILFTPIPTQNHIHLVDRKCILNTRAPLQIHYIHHRQCGVIVYWKHNWATSKSACALNSWLP